ncbi:tyrosine-protein phosphatase [Gordonia paraffinivorans]|uniref:Protein tyrosine/serine phosphatase n=1 Tax=Gordonia paraffinivorans TaxID=175628 RepID=A0ABD7V2S8_9ACTN|nr:tyrosine-protein phosphatase [Gordonia paraffinivorans]MCD2144828.1 tyrosine-protein phosphatase [Gordonia paraffinivorans]VFA88639.1 Protein tyrosine/serine phosphatase [Gordonia paraffinivorans]
MTQPKHAHAIELATVPNLRDLGGWVTADGRKVQTGRVYRSTELHRLAGDDRTKFEELGITLIFDLRTAAERQAAPDPDLPGVTDVPLDVLADSATAIPAHLNAVLADPAMVAKANEALGGGKAETLIEGTYRQIVTLPSARAAYRRFYEELAEPSTSGAALFHCTTGKDRTGWAAATFLTVLGVSRDEVFEDYLLTNDELIPALHPIFAAFEKAGGDPDVLSALLGVRREYLEGAFDEMVKEFGDIDGYFTKGLGLDASVPEKLRERYLEQ